VALVTVSPRYQVVIPKEVREKLGIRPGHKVEAFAVDNRVELVPLEPIQTFRGQFPGLRSESAAFEVVPPPMPDAGRGAAGVVAM
jgi:AbrB family looped-hinge helix DNA binding protein